MKKTFISAVSFLMFSLFISCSTKYPASGPATGLNVNEVVKVRGIGSSVEVVRDIYGIAHIYGSNEKDVAFVQGYIHAHDRLVQMLFQRGAAVGELAVMLGADYIDDDILSRMMKFRVVAAQVYNSLGNDEREFLDSYVEGVNTYLRNMTPNDMPIEFVNLGITSPALLYSGVLSGLMRLAAGEGREGGSDGWHPVDSLAFARLMTFALSFDNEGDWGIRFINVYQGLAQGLVTHGINTYPNTPSQVALALMNDLMVIYPNRADIIAQPGSKGPFLTSGGVQGAPLSGIKKMTGGVKSLTGYLRLMRKITGLNPTSNNWSVRGEKTASRNALLANDPHLSLQQPPVFHEDHINTTALGGDLNAGGVMFPMLPGIVIGFTDYIAWGETTTGYDVTDFYLFPVVATGSKLSDWQVLAYAMTSVVKPQPNSEIIFYLPSSDSPDPCTIPDDTLNNLKELLVYVKSNTFIEGSNICQANLVYYEIPATGPVSIALPIMSLMEDDSGQKYLIAARWTGFEPTNEMEAFYRLLRAKSVEEAKDAIYSYFKVGAQNHNVIDRNGSIGWFPSANIPKRYPATCTTTMFGPTPVPNPLFLPQPGMSWCAWDGYWDVDEVPGLLNPEQGFIVTANNMPISITYNAPVTDNYHYHGYFYDIGYRADRITTRIEEKLGSITAQDMMSIQADDYLGLCEDFLSVLSSTVGANTNSLSETGQQALEYLSSWDCSTPSGFDYDPESGSITETADPEVRKSSIAATVFHAWISNFIHFTFDDQTSGDNGGSQAEGRMLFHLIKRKGCSDPNEYYATPCRVVDAVLSGLGPNFWWDDWSTPSYTETMTDIAVKAYVEAISGLTIKLGTDDVNQWLWGRLHTLTLRHIGGSAAKDLNVPNPTELAYGPFKDFGLLGFPRHGGQFVVDASDPGFGVMTSTSQADYSYGSGPSYRMVVEMTPDGPVAYTTIPGGNVALPRSEFYDNQLRKFWWANQYKKFPFTLDDVKKYASYVMLFEPKAE